MPGTFPLEIVTPDRKFFSDDVEMVVVKTPQGQIGVMKGHIPMVAAVHIGRAKILKNGELKNAILNSGFMEVTRNGVVILVDTAEWPHEIDVNRALEAKKRAEERLERKLSHIEYQRTQAALSRALARIRATRNTGRM